MPRALVVGHNPADRTLAKALLSKAGYDVVEISRGEQCVAVLRKLQVDFVLMDIDSPNVDAIEALGAIRRQWTLKDTPVIALGFPAGHAHRADILAEGFDEFVPKPIDAEKLRNARERVLKNRNAPPSSG